MQQRHEPVPGSDGNPSQESIMERLMEIWHFHDEPSLEHFKRVTELANKLPEAQKALALTAIGKHFANRLSIQYLELMATFWDGLDLKEIDEKELEGTLEDIFPDQFYEMMKLSDHLNIRSLNDLKKACSAIASAHTLCRFTDTENAWSSLYTFSRIAYDTLESAHLLITE